MASSGLMPSTERRGPVMPKSVRKPVPLGRICPSAVGTWVWVPHRAWTRPSRYQASAPFSLVASAWKSTSTRSQRWASVPRSSWLAALKGLSRLEFSSRRPIRFITPIRSPRGPSNMPKPRPGTRPA